MRQVIHMWVIYLLSFVVHILALPCMISCLFTSTEEQRNLTAVTEYVWLSSQLPDGCENCKLETRPTRKLYYGAYQFWHSSYLLHNQSNTHYTPLHIRVTRSWGRKSRLKRRQRDRQTRSEVVGPRDYKDWMVRCRGRDCWGSGQAGGEVDYQTGRQPGRQDMTASRETGRQGSRRQAINKMCLYQCAQFCRDRLLQR